MTQETTYRKPSGLRARLRATRNDERGIALQTVIIMVVLLAIAGTVAAVLLSRASDVTGELENQDITATTVDTEAECLNTSMGDLPRGNWTGGNTCTWVDPDGNNGGNVTRARCSLVGGAFDEKGNSAEECKVEVS